MALAANPATQIEDENTILMDIGSNVNIVGVRVAQNLERTAVQNGHAIQKACIKPPLYISGVGSGSAICNKTCVFPIGVQYKRSPAGNPAPAAGQPASQKTFETDVKNPDLEHFVAAIAEGSGENLPAIMGRRQMAADGAILILEKSMEKYIILKDASYKFMLGKGARVVDLKSAPSGHLAMKVDDFTNAKVKTGQRAYTLHASKGEPHLLEEHNEDDFVMEDALMRDKARAFWPEAPAANAASSSSGPAPAANAATIPPPPSWFDPEQREQMEKSLMCMMSMEHGHLD